MRNYEIDFSEEEQDLATLKIIDFGIELGSRADEPMTLPTLAISSDGPELGQFGFDDGDRFALVIDVEFITKGRLMALSPKDVQRLLFNKSVSEGVTTAILNAVAWTKDVERRGLNATNLREIEGFFANISSAVALGLENGIGGPKPD